MKTNKISLLVLVATLSGCFGGGAGGSSDQAPAVTLPIDTSLNGGSTQTELQKVELNKVVGSDSVDAVNDVFAYNPQGEGEVGECGDGDDCLYHGNVSNTFDAFGVEENYGYSDELDEDGNFVHTDYYRHNTSGDQYGYDSYSNNISTYGGYLPNRLEFREGKDGNIILSVDGLETNEITKNSDGSVSAVLSGPKGDSYKILFGSDDFANINSENRGENHSEYVIWQPGSLIAGEFVPYSGAYTTLYRSDDADRDGFLSDNNIHDKVSDIAEPVEFTGKTHAVKISENGNEELSGNAELVFDLQRTRLNYNLTLDFTDSNWKKIDISGNSWGGTSVKVDDDYSEASASVVMNLKQSGSHDTDFDVYGGKMKEYNKATGIYRVSNIPEGDLDGDQRVGLVGGFGVEAKKGQSLSMGEELNH